MYCPGNINLPVPVLVLEQAGHPGRARPGFRHPPLPIVQAPAIAHEHPPLRGRDNLAPGRNTVLQWHRLFSVVQDRASVQRPAGFRRDPTAHDPTFQFDLSVLDRARRVCPVAKP